MSNAALYERCFNALGSLILFIRSMLFILIVLTFLHPTKAAATTSRSDLPIFEVDLSDGTRRYAVDLQLGDKTIRAGLDTGSVGLRVLTGALQPRLPVTGRSQDYAFNSGTTFSGPVVLAPLRLGTVSGQVRIQDIQDTHCADMQPHCPVSRLPLSKFGIQGDGIPGEGFDAILGIGLFESVLSNPLTQIGVKRWLIRLPRSVDRQGILILNPTNEELVGFAPLVNSAINPHRHNDSVSACISWKGNILCAPTILDTGAPGITVVNSMLRIPPVGTPASLAFAGGPTLSFRTDRRAEASRLILLHDDHLQSAQIRSGLIAYLGYDVLYDEQSGKLSVRRRSDDTSLTLMVPTSRNLTK